MRFELCGLVALLCLALSSCQNTLGKNPENKGAARSVPDGARGTFPEPRFDFGQVISGTIVEHDFEIKNEGTTPLSIQKVTMPTPLLVSRMPRQIAAGSQDTIHFRLDTAGLNGRFDGAVAVFLNDPLAQQVSLTFAGSISPAVELIPMPAVYLSGQKGRGASTALEIVNHEPEPLRIEKVESQTDRFTVTLESLTAGQRYRLKLALKPDGPVGKSTEVIGIRTSSHRAAYIRLPANTYLYDRVHAFPEAIAMGTFRQGAAGQEEFTLMIYQEGGSDFRVKLSTDIPGLHLTSDRGPKGDRYQAKVTFTPGKAEPGAIHGSIFADTNDPKFPRLMVPVSAEIVEH